MLPSVSVRKRTKAHGLVFAHLAGRHRELTMLDRSQAADIAVNLHIIGRIGEHHVGALILHQQRQVI
jgi:hypothetical protein